ncbi:MAG: class I SAM-dependent methyltransferase [Vulcanimicrobiaceae bacterium]|jgi:2-polyprenyl-3-methyl-5-hydroxy-6-metoxy-1,4-benzoquinol methylase
MSNIVSDAIKKLQKGEYGQHRYVSYHAPRYTLLVDVLRGVIQPGARVLDIGKSLLSSFIAAEFQVKVDTLGFQSDGPTDVGQHWHFDLNDSQQRSTWRTDIGPYDVIVMAEVIEHLHTSPALVLAFLNSILAPSGKLVIQTPNAVALHKRVEMLVGRHPYTPINEDALDPSHFREYTKTELYDYLERAGFSVTNCVAGQYFDYRFTRAGMKPYLSVVNLAYRFLPTQLKPGLTLVTTKVREA